MSKVIALNIVFSGTLSQIHSFLNDKNNYEGLYLYVPQDLEGEFDAIANRRDSGIEPFSTRLYPINGDYSYGFDVIDRTNGIVELEIYNSDDNIYHIVDGVAGEARPAEPAEKVEAVIVPPDVTKLTSDDLFKVVANYDVIHAAAKEELNKRIAEVQSKL